MRRLSVVPRDGDEPSGGHRAARAAGAADGSQDPSAAPRRAGDEALSAALNRCARGDHSAFEEVYDATAPGCSASCRRSCGTGRRARR